MSCLTWLWDRETCCTASTYFKITSGIDEDTGRVLALARFGSTTTSACNTRAKQHTGKTEASQADPLDE